MDSFEEQLAAAVRKYENLYNTSCKAYKDTQTANNSWREVALMLCTEEGVCRKRWRYLRDKFAKAKRRVQIKRSRDPSGRKVMPALYTSLRWLDAHIKPREATSNNSVSQIKEMESDPEEGPSFTQVSQPSSHLTSHYPIMSMMDLGSSAPVSPSKFPALPTPTSEPSPTPVASTPGPTQPLAIPPSPSSTVRPPLKSKKRTQGRSACLNFGAALAALDKRRTEHESAMGSGWQRREAMLQLMDPCGRYVLHVADFMRTLPSDVLSDFKWKLQNLMHETEQRVSLCHGRD